LEGKKYIWAVLRREKKKKRRTRHKEVRQNLPVKNWRDPTAREDGATGEEDLRRRRHEKDIIGLPAGTYSRLAGN